MAVRKISARRRPAAVVAGKGGSSASFLAADTLLQRSRRIATACVARGAAHALHGRVPPHLADKNRWTSVSAKGRDIQLSILEGLTGKRLLILEEGFFLDDETRRLLHSAGAVVRTVNGNDADALLAGEMAFDGAILDIDMDAETAFALAERLEALNIPFLFALNDRHAGTAGRFSAYRLCSDPEELKAIREGLFGAADLH